MTLQDVARKAGVHRTTVSLALRDHTSIPKVTRDRIKRVAGQMGYRANPLVTALMRSRRTGDSIKHVALAVLTNHPTRYGWRPPENEEPDFLPGASERARGLGYKLDHFWLAEPGMSSERMKKILQARGIHGIIVGRLPVGQYRIDFGWESFSVVALGQTLQAPLMHHVAEHHFATTNISMRKCIERGYRRIGFAFSAPNEYPLTGDRWLGGYFCNQRPISGGIPVFEGDTSNGREFMAWFRRERPDAILVSKGDRALHWLKKAKVRVPEDVGLVDLRIINPKSGISGVYYDPAKVGALAVEMVVGLIHHGELGIPTDPHEVLLGGVWIEGKTLPQRH